MTPPANAERSKHHRFPGAIIGYGVSLSSRFPLSDRDGQELLCERGIDVTEEAIRTWWHTCGQDYANPLRSWQPWPGDTGHVDAGFLTSNGQRHDLWRAVDQDENLLEMLVQRRW